MNRRWARPALGVALLGALVVILLAGQVKRADGGGTFDECIWGWPVVNLDGVTPYLPVMRWPAGLTFDPAGHRVVDASGATVIARGDRVIVRGTIRDMSGGDIPPCFVTYGIDLERIEPG